MLSQLVGAIPDVYTGEDGVTRIIFDIESGQFESLYLALQLLLEDMFVSTASSQALVRHGDQYGLPMKVGTRATGTLMFSGEGGTFIPQGTLVSYDPGSGVDPIPFETTEDASVPSPGDPSPPHVVVGAAGNLTGGYEYVVTFLTSQGETLPSDSSQILVLSAQQASLTLISIGGPGTTGRRLYRDKNGVGDYRLVYEFTDNTTAAYTDNATDASIAAAQTLPTSDTAHRVPAQGVAVDPGVDGNVIAGAITIISDGPPTLSDVTNITAFTGGADPEDSEVYRGRLLDFIQNPQTGSASDIQAWATTVPGVETAAVFENTPSAGSVTVRITGPNGSVAPPEVIDAVQTALDDQDYANITIVVSSFTALLTDVSVTTTLQTGFTLAGVTPSVQTAISNYITALGAGETLRVAGIVDSVFGLAGIADVVVTIPSANQTTAATSKRMPGTITVS
jgi:uncharacterized phage protein gp47/JayE